MQDNAYKEALLQAERIYGVTEPASWFIRIHDEVDLKEIQTYEWLRARKPRGLAANDSYEESAGAIVVEMEQEHFDIRLSTYLHEYCHFLQLTSSPYHFYLNTVQQYQSSLVIRLCRELAHSEIELPLREFIRTRAIDSTAFQVLMKKYVEPWERCEKLIRFLEYGEYVETNEPLKPIELYSEVNELLLEFNHQLRELSPINTIIRKLLSSFLRGNQLTFDAVRPLISYQPGLRKESQKQPPTISVEENSNRIGFGGRAISEGAAASAQFFYIAARQSWTIQSLNTINALALDEYTTALDAASEYEGFNRLGRYSKFFAFYTLCDLALQTPLHPVYSDMVCPELRWNWPDYHPGHRFCGALNKIDWNSVPQVSQEEFEGLWSEDSRQSAVHSLGAKLERFSNQVCESLGWPKPSDMAKSASNLASRGDDFITKLRVKANKLRIECPGLLMIPLSSQVHAALPPIGIFAGKEFRGNLMDNASASLNALISNYLLNTFSRQIMSKSSVIFYRQDSIVYTWLLSAELIEKFKSLFSKIFWIAPDKVERNNDQRNG
ncbi:MAG TPA: hypothetical protein VFS90_03870 [Pyrinomonadaceae bacterium]|nr:hypothetical protein [Pyrinomonadaceae bacterium]